MKKKLANRNLRLGLAGEFRVMAELLMRGFNPSLMALDEGVDIILENGIKIQVKSSTASLRKQLRNRGKDYYSINLMRRGKKTGNLKDSVDFVIVWAYRENDFFILPANKLRSHSSISLMRESKSKWYQYLNNWDSLRRGGE